MSLRDADLRKTLGSFGSISGLAIEIDDGIEGTVTLELDAVPWDQAFEKILSVNGLASTIEDGTVRIHRATAAD